MAQASRLEIIPLGGLGEFGMNIMVYRWGDDCVIVDAGMMFPGQEHLGVDVVLPDLSFLEDCGTIHGLILTHGHEDHIGTVPYLMARRDLPVYATPYTEALVRRRLDEHGITPGGRLRRLPDGDQSVGIGPFSVETIAVAHSIPQARMIVLRTPAGLIVHTADFKIDTRPPVGPGTDLRRLAAIADEGVLLLLSDSTNADRPGFTPGERSASAGIERVVATAKRRILVTTFSSHVHRISEIGRLAAASGRKVSVVGASIEGQVAVAESLGILSFPPGVLAPTDTVMNQPPERGLLIVSGSQGEPMSSMARVALGKHRQIELEDGDTVIHSARRIPGNEKSIDRLIDHCLRRGAEVITADDAPIHVSGHGCREELGLVLQMLRPKFFVPLHGEYRQLRAHARLACDSGMDSGRVVLAESGDVIGVGSNGIGVEDRVQVGRVFVDATQDEVDLTVLRDRRRIADDGIVVPVVAVDRERGPAGGLPEIMTRGFVPDGEQVDEELMLEARRLVATCLEDATPEERTDEGVLRAKIQTELKRLFRRRGRRRPLIHPVIVEL